MNKISSALCLMHSMILSGESFTEKSELAFKEALDESAKLAGEIKGPLPEEKLKGELEVAVKLADEGKARELDLRRLLWLRHDPDHFAALYGDDGEMQCSACGIDFKRYTPSAMEKVWVDRNKKMLEEMQKRLTAKPK